MAETRDAPQQVVVIGGGVAGLTAALHLAERGLRPYLIEAEPNHIGGRLRGGPDVTIEHAGRIWHFPGEHGVHGIWSPYLNLKKMLARRNLLPTLWPSPDEAWIYGDGRRIRRCAIGRAIHTSPFPAPLHYLHLFTRLRFVNMLSPADLLALPRVMGTLLVALAVDPIGEQNPLRGETLAEFTRGWSPRVRSFFAGLARNALAAHPEEAPAAGFIAFLRFYTIARRDTWAFALLPGTGGLCMAEPLAREIQALGGTIRMGTRVTRLERSAGSWQVRLDDQSSITAAHVVLALDAPAAAHLLRSSPTTANVAEQLWFPQGVPTAIFRVWFDQRPRTPAPTGIFSGDFTVDNFFWLEQFQPAYAAWSAATGGSALEMHIYGPPEVLAQPDAVLLARAVGDAGRAFPELAGRILHAEVIRNPPTHTLFSVGRADQHLGVETPWPGIVACGDWVAHPTPALYLERAATTGIAAANVVLQAYGYAPWPLHTHLEPEPLARWIGEQLRRFRRR